MTAAVTWPVVPAIPERLTSCKVPSLSTSAKPPEKGSRTRPSGSGQAPQRPNPPTSRAGPGKNSGPAVLFPAKRSTTQSPAESSGRISAMISSEAACPPVVPVLAPSPDLPLGLTLSGRSADRPTAAHNMIAEITPTVATGNRVFIVRPFCFLDPISEGSFYSLQVNLAPTRFCHPPPPRKHHQKGFSQKPFVSRDDQPILRP